MNRPTPQATTAGPDASRDTLLNAILESGVVAVIRMPDSERLIRIVEAIREGGITAIEITMTTPNALSVIAQVASRMHGDVLIGVGSVIDAATAHRAVDAGAQYVVSPIFKPEVIAAAHQRGVPAMPGAFTPTEIQLATESGADVVKVFPADIVGMPFFKAVLAPLPHLKLMPTGGVSLTNAGEWIRAGACAVGVGSALLDKAAIEAEDYGTLMRNARTLRDAVDRARSEQRISSGDLSSALSGGSSVDSSVGSSVGSSVDSSVDPSDHSRTNGPR